jgi:hypothetical protein
VKYDEVEVKRSEVKVVYVHGRDSSDYVATSYRFDGPGSFPCNILVFFMYVSFMYYVFFFLFLVFCNVHVLALYLCTRICTVFYCGCSCTSIVL